MNFSYDGAYVMPGQQAAVETYENEFWFGERHQQLWTGMILSGASRDTGNTSYTTILRTGLLMGMVTSTKKIKEWNPTGVDGSENIIGVLHLGINTQRLGTNDDKWLAYLMVGGTVKADRLIMPGTAALGISGVTYEYMIRAQMHRRFLFSDKWEGNPFGGWKNIVESATDTNNSATPATATTYSVTYAQNNTLFTTRGHTGATITYTLPALPKKGLRYGFHAVELAVPMAITSSGSSDNLVGFNDKTADTLSFATTNEVAGGYFEVIGDGTGWLVQTSCFGLGATAQTVTTA